MHDLVGLVAVLQALAVIVIIAEFILPSGGLLTAAAVGLFGYSLYVGFARISPQAGFILVAVDVVVIPLSLLVGMKLLARSPVTLRSRLSRSDGVSSQTEELASFLGREGTTLTDLRPSGISIIDGRRLDTVTNGEYIEKKSTVTVVEVSGNRVVVRKKE